MEFIKPAALENGATIGIFSPSSPAYIWARGVYEHALLSLQSLGFNIREGSLTHSRNGQGYRSGTPQERAAEFMELILDPEVSCLMATIGGFNSASLIPYLDFSLIRKHPKIIVGYSDVTVLHLAILRYAGVRTFYGPAVVPSFGEYPQPLRFTLDSFLDACQRHRCGTRTLQPPKEWSNHRRDWTGDSWKTKEREMQKNEGWKVLRPGKVTAPIIVANLNTLMSCAGTEYFPKTAGKILLIEQEQALMAYEERLLRQLERIGVMHSLSGLIIGKSEHFERQGAPFGYEDLLLEILPAETKYPVISNFDCGHTHPMITLGQMTLTSIDAEEGLCAISLEEPMVQL